MTLRRFKQPSALLTLLLLAVMCGCQQQHTNERANAITVTDFAGLTVELSAPAQRIVALAPHAVENLFTIGAGKALVGVMQYSDFPPAAKLLPVVGGYQSVNFERILELQPDLIIAWQTGNSQAAINRLKELGFKVYIDQPDALRDVAKSLRDFGALSGLKEPAEAAARDYLQQISAIEAQYEGSEPVSFFYQVWNSPLQTINGEHTISDAIETCGGVNIYADEIAVAPVINIESVLERNPQVIIASGNAAGKPAWLDDWLQWPTLDAVANENLFYINPDYIQRHTVRLLKGLNTLCQQLDLVRAKAGA